MNERGRLVTDLVHAAMVAVPTVLIIVAWVATAWAVTHGVTFQDLIEVSQR